MITKPVILQVVPELTTGGAELSAIEIAQAVQSSGGQAIVIAKSGAMIPRLNATGARYIALDVATKNPAKIIKNISVLAGIIKENNVSLIHARSRAPAWSSFFAARKTKIPYLATYHGAYGEKEPFKRLYNSVMARGDLTIANSNYVKQLVCERHGVSDQQVRTIYRGVDFETYNPANVRKADKIALSEKWQVGQGQKLLLLAARLSPIKGHLVVIEAANQLQKEGVLKDAVFIFAGGDQGRAEYVQKLKDKIKAYGLGQNFRLVGHVDNMAAAYGLSTVSMSTSLVPETFGRTGAEAQAMECPIIATTLGAPKETCLATPVSAEADITGWLTGADDVQGLVNALKNVLKMEDDARLAIGKRARAFVLKKFPVEKMQSQTLEVYDELLGTKLAKSFKST